MSDEPVFLHDPNLGVLMRAHRGDNFKVSRAATELLADAIEIADSTARSDIECFFLRNEEGWYNLSDGMPYDWLPQILRYLTARGLIERKTEHTCHADQVRFVKRT